MGAYNWVSLHLLGPALDAVRGTETISSLRELEESQWWPADRLAELQSRRLRALVQHAYEHVPFYRRYMYEAGLSPAHIQSAAELHLLPVLNRADVRRLSSELLAEYVPGNRTVTARTGGSTGEPLRFLSTPHDRYSRGFARSLRAQGWSGCSLGDRSFLVVEPRDWRSVRHRLMAALARRVQRTWQWEAGDMSKARLETMARLIESRRIRLMLGFPSALCLLASHVRERGGLSHNLKGIVTGGEPLYEHQRQLLQGTFGVMPLSKYSSNEILDIACQCEMADGYHIAVEDVVVEILDEQGNRLPLGGVGRVVVTNLHNPAMPFIRYDIGDAGALGEHACSCGRGLPLLSNLEGRRSDVLLTPDGRRIPGILLPWSYLADLGVQQIQILQEQLETIRVRVVLEPSMERDAAAAVLQSIRSRYTAILGETVAVEVETATEIPAGPRGKRAVVVSKLASGGDGQ
ncbi:phenylacetate--CoA ligase family protein [Chloroflexota bacterium]